MIGPEEKIRIDAARYPNHYTRGPGPHLIPGTSFAIEIPYEGDHSLWQFQPSTFGLPYPEISIESNTISFSVSFQDDAIDGDKLKNSIDRDTHILMTGVGHIYRDVEAYNADARLKVSRALARRRELAQRTLNVVSSLGIPLKSKAEPALYVAPIKRKQLPVRPVPAKGNFAPEPALEEQQYLHILAVLRSMAIVMERSPNSFATLDEEAIRTHFLLQLNGHYEGEATGETFNHEGKTDILIRSGNRNVFIAECKFWRGPKVFSETIDQLLGYLTWRDSKCALLIFNQNKDSASVREKMHETMIARAECKKTIEHNANGDSRYILVKTTEPGREIIVTTQLYDIPLKESSTLESEQIKEFVRSRKRRDTRGR